MSSKKCIDFLKEYKKWVVVVCCFIMFFELAIAVYLCGVTRRDTISYDFISSHFINDRTIPIVKIITRCGSATVLLIFASLIAVYFWEKYDDKKTGFFVFLNLGLIGLLNQILKRIIRRPRPSVYRIIEEKGFSFPSGHSMGSMAFYGFLIYLIYKKVENKKLKWSLIVFLSLFTVLIGCSRIFLGVHYATDVLAGFLLTIAYLTIYTSIIDEYIGTEKKKNVEKD